MVLLAISNNMIVKMQRPLTTNATFPEILIYNKDKSFMLQLPYTFKMRKLFAGRHKIYCKVHIKDKELFIDKEIKEKSW